MWKTSEMIKHKNNKKQMNIFVYCEIKTRNVKTKQITKCRCCQKCQGLQKAEILIIGIKCLCKLKVLQIVKHAKMFVIVPATSADWKRFGVSSVNRVWSPSKE